MKIKLFIKIILISVFVFVANSNTIAQESDMKIENDGVFIMVEKMPKFPGGMLALRKHLAFNIIYPEKARKAHVQGTVYIRFVILKDGDIGEVKVLRGVDHVLDAEAVRVVKTLPKFEPGEQRGKKVKVWFSVPIKFTLN